MSLGKEKFIVQKGAGGNCLPIIWEDQPMMSHLKKPLCNNQVYNSIGQ